MKTVLLVFTISTILLSGCGAGKNVKTVNRQGLITNPLLPGDYPDPDILVDGNDFYLLHSSFLYYPGLTIWHSIDLVNWVPVTSALTTFVGSVWAPDLVKHGNRYYIYFPANNRNFVIFADSIHGPWSEPIDLNIGHIDPGHFVDDQGNRYLFFSGGGYVQLSPDGLTVEGEYTHVYHGWPIPREWTIECFCMEAPTMAKRGDYYYLTVAQGGTAGPPTGHMVISARSRSPLGPWDNSPYNPIARAQQDDKWASVGHATIFQGPTGCWWMIFHGYQQGHYNMGRQTLLAPIEWTPGGWFKLPDDYTIGDPIYMPGVKRDEGLLARDSGFGATILNPRWKFFGHYDKARYKVAGTHIDVKAMGNSITGSAPLLWMPSDHSYIVQVQLELTGNSIGGLVLYYSHKAYSGILADSSNIFANLRGWQFPTEGNPFGGNLFLRLKNRNGIVDMFYGPDGNSWTKIENSAVVTDFHHNVLSDFLALRIGLVAMGDGQVRFSNFSYQPLPD